MIIKDGPIVDFNGNQLKNTDETPATLVGCIVQSLLILQGAQVGGQESFKRYEIAKNVHEGRKITVADGETIKTVAAGVFHPLTYGRIVDAIEGAAKKSAEKPQPE